MPLKSSSIDLIGASGECILAFTPQKQLVCALHNSRQVVGVWPYSSLRNYWGSKDKFGFVAGRRAPRGEGDFNFTTNQGEEMFQMLERLIKIMSKNSSHQVECTQVEAVVQHTDLKVGIESPAPPILSKPPKLKKRMTTPGPLPPLPVPSVSSLLHSNSCTTFPSTITQEINSNTIVSDTSPAYFKSHSVPTGHKLQKDVSRTASSISYFSSSSFPLEQLHSKRGTHPSIPSSSPPSWETGNQEGDTYSHTAHNLPVQFSRNSTLKIIKGDSIYHGLVQVDNRGSSSIKLSPKKTATVDPSADSTVVYDLAYHPSFQQPKVLVPVLEGDYGSIGNATEQQREIRERNLLKSAKDIKSVTGESEQLHPGVESVDGRNGGGRKGVVSGSGDDIDGRSECATNKTIKNPMYGSKDNIFTDSVVDIVVASVSREGRTASTGSQESKRGIIDDYRVDRLMNDMVLNPVYGDHHPPNHRTNSPSKKSSKPEILPGHGVTGEATMPINVQQSKEEEPVGLQIKFSMVDNPVYNGGIDPPIVNTKTVEMDSNDASFYILPVSGLAIGQGCTKKASDCVNQEFLPTSKDAAIAHKTISTNHVTQEPSPYSVEIDNSTMEVDNNCNCTHTGDSDTLCRDALGYTKVDKTSSRENSPLPPLPPRMYSIA